MFELKIQNVCLEPFRVIWGLSHHRSEHGIRLHQIPILKLKQLAPVVQLRIFLSSESFVFNFLLFKGHYLVALLVNEVLEFCDSQRPEVSRHLVLGLVVSIRDATSIRNASLVLNFMLHVRYLINEHVSTDLDLFHLVR